MPETSNITNPFDPTKIDVDIATVNLGSIIDSLANDEIDLQPDFQRSSDIWSSVQKSRLIESILLGLPLPSFYFSEDPTTKKLQIIDGLQRLCAIRDFVLEKKTPLRLKGLQFLKNDYEGKVYSDLERPDIRRIQSLKVTVNTLRKDTPTNVKYVIFQRVNTSGTKLKPQEMRQALNQGQAAQFIKELAESEAFLNATNRRISPKRMDDKEYVNYFVAFYLDRDLKDYTNDVDYFLNVKMEELNSISSQELGRIRIAFKKSMVCCHNIFGTDAFRPYNIDKQKYNKISKILFYTISVSVALLTELEQKKLEGCSSNVVQDMKSLYNDSQFLQAMKSSTNQKANVELRFNKVKELLNKELSND